MCLSVWGRLYGVVMYDVGMWVVSTVDVCECQCGWVGGWMRRTGVLGYAGQ